MVTDHCPLESIFNNIKQIQSACLERWRLRLAAYNIMVKDKTGKQMISDYCSRHSYHPHATIKCCWDYVTFLAHAALHASLKLSDVAKATDKDCALQCVMTALHEMHGKNNLVARTPDLNAI